VIYLDHNATTPLSSEVLDAMLPYFKEEFGNPSARYPLGQRAKNAVEKARMQVADLIEAQPEEIIFTSGATEANNTAIYSAIRSQPDRKHIVTSSVEHPSVLNPLKRLEKEGYRITYLPVDQNGQIDLKELANSITSETALVSMMWANNETGIIFPIKQISELCLEKAVLFHCDAVQAIGKVPVNLMDVEIDFLTLSAHKFYGPKGIGALYLKEPDNFIPLLLGGGQEEGKRAGTENAPLIVGCGKAAEKAKQLPELYQGCVRDLRDRFETELLASEKAIFVFGKPSERIPNTTNFAIQGLLSEEVLSSLQRNGIYVSAGSSCHESVIEPSHVIQAITRDYGLSQSAVRISFGIATDIDIKRLVSLIHGL